MSNKLFLDDFPPPSAELTEAVKQITEDLCNRLYAKLNAIDASVSDEEINLFVQDLNKVAEDNKGKINHISVVEDKTHLETLSPKNM